MKFLYFLWIYFYGAFLSSWIQPTKINADPCESGSITSFCEEIGMRRQWMSCETEEIVILLQFKIWHTQGLFICLHLPVGMISRRRRSTNSSGKCAIYFSSVKATRSCNGWPFLRWALLSFPELPPFRLSSSSSASSVRSSFFLIRSGRPLALCYESVSGRIRKFSPRSDPDLTFFWLDNCWKFFLKRVQFFFDYPDHAIPVHISLQNLQNVFKMSCSCFIMKTCQLLSWPGLDGRIRIRIRPKSFRIHNTVFFAKSACM